MADAHLASADQRGRLMMTNEILNQSSLRIKESRRTVFETEELGISILQDLHQQREILLHSHTKLHGVDDAIDKSKKILGAMAKRMNRNKLIVGSIIAVLILLNSYRGSISQLHVVIMIVSSVTFRRLIWMQRYTFMDFTTDLPNLSSKSLILLLLNSDVHDNSSTLRLLGVDSDKRIVFYARRTES